MAKEAAAVEGGPGGLQQEPEKEFLSDATELPEIRSAQPLGEHDCDNKEPAGEQRRVAVGELGWKSSELKQPILALSHARAVAKSVDVLEEFVDQQIEGVHHRAGGKLGVLARDTSTS
ncbi:hypothetical protein [Streptomyces sp. NEAU-174]|uniref:hypothetical protein n=1 Tax=Streptomyces sp. NEAU-174 TaxID=3458254 RepID=UPI0040451694